MACRGRCCTSVPPDSGMRAVDQLTLSCSPSTSWPCTGQDVTRAVGGETEGARLQLLRGSEAACPPSRAEAFVKH